MVYDECQGKLRLHISPNAMRGRRRVARSVMSLYGEGVNGVYGSELRVKLGSRPRHVQLLVIEGRVTLLLCDSRLRQGGTARMSMAVWRQRADGNGLLRTELMADLCLLFICCFLEALPTADTKMLLTDN